MFLAKYDSLGNLVFAFNVGSTDFAEGAGLAVDGAGNVFVTGGFFGTADFDPGPGVTSLTSNGSFGMFLAEYDPLGNLVLAFKVGAAGGLARGFGVAVDGASNVFVTGVFAGNAANFDPGPGVNNLANNGPDMFLAKYDSLGNLVFAFNVGSSTDIDEGSGVGVDGAGNVLVTGEFTGTADFDPGPGVTNLTSNGGGDLFLAKYDTLGNLVFAFNVGSSNFDEGFGVAVDGAGNVLVTGLFGGTADFDPGPGVNNLTSNGGGDLFLAKYNVPADISVLRVTNNHATQSVRVHLVRVCGAAVGFGGEGFCEASNREVTLTHNQTRVVNVQNFFGINPDSCATGYLLGLCGGFQRWGRASLSPGTI